MANSSQQIYWQTVITFPSTVLLPPSLSPLVLTTKHHKLTGKQTVHHFYIILCHSLPVKPCPNTQFY